MRIHRTTVWLAGAALAAHAGLAGCGETESTPPDEVSQAPPAGAEQSGVEVTELDPGQGDQAEQPENRILGAMAMDFPTGDEDTSLIRVEQAGGGDEIRVGQNYQYQLNVTNLSDDLTLENVVVRQAIPENVEIVQSEPQPAGREGGEQQWEVGQLAPGQTRQISITGVAHEQGQVQSCVRVTYNPVLCTTFNVVAPELEVTKQAPETASICDPITFRYTIRNVGTGTTEAVTLSDPLPEGLVGPEGEQELTLQIEPLSAGETKQVEVALKATQPGEFSSRATASTESGLEVASRQTTTQVRQPDLAVQIQAPQAEYINSALQYRVAVTNQGKGPAREGVLTLRVDPDTQIVGAGDIRVEGETATVQLPEIAPGAAHNVNLTLVKRTPGEITVVAQAQAACTPEGAEAATAQATTQIIGVTSLLLEVVDNQDPIKIGADEIYQIAVVNQGSVPDTNIQIRAELPEGMQFVSAEGQTEATNEGNMVTFQPVEQLAPGERATWAIRVRADQAGQQTLKVELSSESLDESVVEEEATRAF